MSTALAKLDPEIMEQLVVHGDLSRLSPPQRLAYYAARCEAAGLDPRARPFQYLQLQGKLVLYADKSCADQLCAQHKLTVEIVSRGTVGDCYEVHARVRRQDGTSVDNLGVVPLAGKRGDDLANAVMKAATKAIRRATLAACGLGMLDDSEVETIRDARRVTITEAEVTAPALPPVPALPEEAVRRADALLAALERKPQPAPDAARLRAMLERVTEYLSGGGEDSVESERALIAEARALLAEAQP